MNMKKVIFLLFVVNLCYSMSVGQDTNKYDKAIYKERKPGFYQTTIKKSFQKAGDENEKQAIYLGVDLTGLEFPTDMDLYDTYWHNEPVSQGLTGTCWSYATVSFFESEVNRLYGNEVKLSEMYIVYWEYVERAKSFVDKRGDVYFAQGSEATAVIRIMKKYGIVPLKDYEGKPGTEDFHNHREMFKEMNAFLEKVKQDNAWNKEVVVSTIKQILDHYMGEPPETIIVNSKTLTPKEYLDHILELDLYDYYSFMSTMSLPYNQRGELVEPDNWWHCDEYYNISLEDYFDLIRSATMDGFSICICGDVSEPGHDSFSEVSIIPTFDIPADFINDDSRQYRLNNGSTTDDHCIHIVGHYMNGDNWFLIKDSGSGAFDGPNKGYRFMREDYIKLKMMNVMIHKDGARPVLDKIIK